MKSGIQGSDFYNVLLYKHSFTGINNLTAGNRYGLN